jgi:HlyD family secretion protein
MARQESFDQKIEIRSSEIQDIIGRMPSRIVQWGISVLFLVIVGLFLISWFIRYPDLLPAKVIITTSPPPLALVSRTSGSITMLKKEDDWVNPQDIIALIQSNAHLSAVTDLENSLAKPEFAGIKDPGLLGDLLPFHNDLLNAHIALHHFTSNKIFETQIAQLKKQVVTTQKLIEAQSKQYKLAQRELTLAFEKFKTDSLLHIQGVTSRIDFNAAKSTWLQQQRNARSVETTVLNSEAQLYQLNKQISDLEIQSIEQQQKLTVAVQQASQRVQAQVLKWKESYLFIAPISGRLSYLGIMENGKYIEASKPCFSIIPESGVVLARAELPLKGSGKVKVGQAVNIRLENYPFEEFGFLRGEISSISLLPTEDKYWVTITLPSPLMTSLKKPLPFKQQLSGTTEIITEDLSLMSRFFSQFRKILQAR